MIRILDNINILNRRKMYLEEFIRIVGNIQENKEAIILYMEKILYFQSEKNSLFRQLLEIKTPTFELIDSNDTSKNYIYVVIDKKKDLNLKQHYFNKAPVCIIVLYPNNEPNYDINNEDYYGIPQIKFFFNPDTGLLYTNNTTINNLSNVIESRLKSGKLRPVDIFGFSGLSDKNIQQLINMAKGSLSTRTNRSKIFLYNQNNFSSKLMNEIIGKFKEKNKSNFILEDDGEAANFIYVLLLSREGYNPLRNFIEYFYIDERTQIFKKYKKEPLFYLMITDLDPNDIGTNFKITYFNVPVIVLFITPQGELNHLFNNDAYNRINNILTDFYRKLI